MGHTGYFYWPITYELSQTAYTKIVLHALKHPSSAVNGILFGRFRTNHIIEIVDAMPVSHSASTFFTPYQIALHQTGEHFYRPHQLNVLGYYHANETYDDCKLGPAASKYVDQMFLHCRLCAVLLLDHKKLHHLIKEKDGDPAVMLFTCGISKTPCLQTGPEARDKLVLKAPSAHALLADYIASKKWVKIVDFEDHLNDITKVRGLAKNHEYILLLLNGRRLRDLTCLSHACILRRDWLNPNLFS